MKYLLALAAALCIPFRSYAQHGMGAGISEAGYGMIKTNINASYDHTWGGISDGFSTRVSYLCLKNRMFTATVNARYSSVTADFGADGLTDGYDPGAIGLNATHLTGQLGLSVSARGGCSASP